MTFLLFVSTILTKRGYLTPYFSLLFFPSEEILDVLVQGCQDVEGIHKLIMSLGNMPPFPSCDGWFFWQTEQGRRVEGDFGSHRSSRVKEWGYISFPEWFRMCAKDQKGTVFVLFFEAFRMF